MSTMIEATLAKVAIYLSEKFNLPKEQVLYTDMENIFNELSEEVLPLKLPCISFYNTDINKTSISRGAAFSGATVTSNINSTIMKIAKIELVNFAISINLIANNTKDYFKMQQDYFSILKDSSITIPFIFGREENYFDVSIFDLQSLGTPPGGRFGRDYDRGNIYLTEGGFSINSFLFYEEEEKMVRKIKFTLSLDDYYIENRIPSNGN